MNGLCKWNNEYVVSDDGILKTCIVDAENCESDKICAQEEELAQLLNHVRNHALLCPEEKDNVITNIF